MLRLLAVKTSKHIKEDTMKLDFTKAITALTVILLVTGSGLAGTQYVIGVDGLTCPFCAYGLEKKLKKVKGVESVSIDLEKDEAILLIKDGTVVQEEDIRKAVKKAGFSVASLKKEATERHQEVPR